MKPRISFIAFLFFALIPSPSFCQSNLARIVVINFNYINVPKADAVAITGLFETALVKTKAYYVIEQNQVADILKTQEISLAFCTDEKCAIEVGKLLSAEQIVLGTLSYIGGKYILNVKIIDVLTGKNLKADKIDARSIAQMIDASEILAFKLSGLTYYKGETVEIARQFSEVFVKTEPEGAEIYINGVKRGVSPELISKVPVGKVVIECRKDNLYGHKEVEFGEGTKEIAITLSEIYGSLFIRSSERRVKAYLDGKFLGNLESGFFKNLPIGEYILELIGDGVYWQERVKIRAEEGTRVEANPKEFGIIQYDIPEGAFAEVIGEMFREVVKGRGELPIWTGSYRVKVTGNIYNPYETILDVERGAKLKLKPDLSFNKEHEREQLQRLVAEKEMELSDAYTIKKEDLVNLNSLKEKIKSSKYVYADLIVKMEYLIKKANDKLIIQEKKDKLEELVSQKTDLEKKIERMNKSKKTRTIFKWSALGAATLSAGLTGLFFSLSNDAYESYKETTITEEAVKYREEVQKWYTFTYIAVGASFVSLGVFIWSWIMDQEPSRYESKLNDINLQIDQLRKN